MPKVIRQSCVCSILVLACAAISFGDLKEYVQKPDDSFSFKIVAQQQVGSSNVYTVKLTSQTWRDITWEHWLSLIVPQTVQHPDKAILLITGGSVSNGPPKVEGSEAMFLAQVANQCGVVVAILQQVPNQPLMGGLVEDALIAHSFDQYLKTQEEDWPLLLPMVKSAVRAMDTIAQISNQKLGLSIEQFIVTGASKRGWTTYLTAAIDPRVCAIAPMVIDVLNMSQQMEHHVLSYGSYSEKIHDYTDRDIFGRLDSPTGARLTKMVDPFNYLDLLTMPKLILLGTNDPFWTVDSASLYYSQLQGPKSLFYTANAGHGLGLQIAPTLLAFFKSALAEKTLAKLQWQKNSDGSLSVQWDQPGARAVLWKAHAQSRDFRQATWTPQPLSGNRSCEVSGQTPKKGWIAYYVQVQFNAPDQLPYGLTTEMTVLQQVENKKSKAKSTMSKAQDF